MNGEAGRVVELRDVLVRYDGNVVLEDIDFDLSAGEIVAVVGPNGGGKSTLLKVILGIKNIEKGTVRVLGKPPSEARNDMGFLPQISTYKRSFPVTVLDVVLMGMYGRLGLFRRPKRREREKAMDTLGQVDMAQLASRPFKDLSGGQQQRVGIARALVSEPRLLLLDEPSTGVDVVAQESFYRLLEKFRGEKGISVVIVSHDVGMIAPVVDRVALLNRNIHYYGEPTGALAPAMLEKAFGAHVRLLVHDEHCLTCSRR